MIGRYIHEVEVTVPGGRLFVRHTPVDSSGLSVLFVHGLGENGSCFEEALTSAELGRCGLIIPDLLGYGASSEAIDADYSIAAQVQRLLALIEHLGVHHVALVGHSLGGDIATILATQHPESVTHLVNVEGDLTQHDVFISNRAVDADRKGHFQTWLRREFMTDTVLGEWGTRASCRRYYAALERARPEAFLQNAYELLTRNTKCAGSWQSEIGDQYARLRVPRVFCYGSDSVQSSTLRFLADKGLAAREFPNAFHWVMIDAADVFYPFLEQFLAGTEMTGRAAQ